jgi:hypothetical protein
VAEKRLERKCVGSLMKHSDNTTFTKEMLHEL